MLARIEWSVPRHIGIKSFAVFLCATAIAGVVLGDHTKAVTSAVTAASGLSIDQVVITGQSETSEVSLLDQLAIGELRSLFTYDVDAARRRVEAMPWIAQATVRKLYPDTLEVAVVERLPYALWQHEGTVSLIDPQGRVITNTVGERYADLPRVVGPGANTKVDEFLALALDHPTLLSRIRAGVLISERRWNVVLVDGVEIMLPEANPADALTRVVDVDGTSGLLARDISVVDVRFPERFVVRLNEGALVGREAILTERAKLAQQKGTST